MQSSDSRPIPADTIVALPSLSCSLSALPQAKSINNVSLHPTMYAQRAAESEAKVSHSPPFSFKLSPLIIIVVSAAKSPIKNRFLLFPSKSSTSAELCVPSELKCLAVCAPFSFTLLSSFVTCFVSLQKTLAVPILHH